MNVKVALCLRKTTEALTPQILMESVSFCFLIPSDFLLLVLHSVVGADGGYPEPAYPQPTIFKKKKKSPGCEIFSSQSTILPKTLTLCACRSRLRAGVLQLYLQPPCREAVLSDQSTAGLASQAQESQPGLQLHHPVSESLGLTITGLSHSRCSTGQLRCNKGGLRHRILYQVANEPAERGRVLGKFFRKHADSGV